MKTGLSPLYDIEMLIKFCVFLEFCDFLELEIHSVYQAVIGTGFTWQCGGIAQLVELLI